MLLSQYDLSSNYNDTLPFDFQTDHLVCDKIEISLVSLVEKGQNYDKRKKTFILENEITPSQKTVFFPSTLGLYC